MNTRVSGHRMWAIVFVPMATVLLLARWEPVWSSDPPAWAIMKGKCTVYTNPHYPNPCQVKACNNYLKCCEGNCDPKCIFIYNREEFDPVPFHAACFVNEQEAGGKCWSCQVTLSITVFQRNFNRTKEEPQNWFMTKDWHKATGLCKDGCWEWCFHYHDP